VPGHRYRSCFLPSKVRTCIFPLGVPSGRLLLIGRPDGTTAPGRTPAQGGPEGDDLLVKERAGHVEKEVPEQPGAAIMKCMQAHPGSGPAAELKGEGRRITAISRTCTGAAGQSSSLRWAEGGPAEALRPSTPRIGEETAAAGKGPPKAPLLKNAGGHLQRAAGDRTGSNPGACDGRPPGLRVLPSPAWGRRRRFGDAPRARRAGPA